MIPPVRNCHRHPQLWREFQSRRQQAGLSSAMFASSFPNPLLDAYLLFACANTVLLSLACLPLWPAAMPTSGRYRIAVCISPSIDITGDRRVRRTGADRTVFTDRVLLVITTWR